MPRKNALGRDFMSLLDDNIPEGKKNSVMSLRMSDIEPRKSQPRKTFEEESLAQLADSIKTHGVLQPIIVRESAAVPGMYEIIAGERRWRASKLAGLTEIPVVIFDGDDLKSAQVAIIENVQRQDLNPLEEALSYRDLIERFGLTQEQVAEQVGKSRPTITNLMRLLDLPGEVLDMLKEGKITTGHARTLLSLRNTADIVPLAHKIYMRGLSVREIEAAVKRLNAENSRSVKENTGKTETDEQTAIYMHELEHRSTSILGRKVRILNEGKKKTVELSFSDNDDLAELMRRICGDNIFEEDQ